MTTQLTAALLWQATIVLLALDAGALLLVQRTVSPNLFLELRVELPLAAFLVFAVIWAVFASWLYWDEVYSVLFAAWTRWLLPVLFGITYALLALAFWRLATHMQRWPVPLFISLGGLASLPGHGIGISRGLLQVPLLADVSVASALVFGVFEFIFYWCVIVGLAAATHQLRLVFSARLAYGAVLHQDQRGPESK